MIRAIGVGDNFIDRYLFQNMMYVGGNSLNFAVTQAQTAQWALL